MKKTLLSLVGISAVALGVANAQLDISTLFSDGLPLEDDAYTQLLNDYESSWWYFDDSITCEVNDGVTITTPTVEDSTIDVASSYNLFVSPYRIDQIKDWDSSIDISKIIMKNVEIKGSDETVEFKLASNELSPNTAYYGFISPVDSFDEVGTPSNEICFKVSDKKCLQDTACDTLNVATATESQGTEEITGLEDILERHGSADCIGMDMANVTHTLNGDTVTLRWTAVDGDVVEIAIWDPDEKLFKSVWSARMSDEKFDYKMKWDGEQNFTLTNGCKGVNYKADAKRWAEPEIKATPATGPAENILYVAIAAIVLYGAYTILSRKSDN